MARNGSPQFGKKDARGSTWNPCDQQPSDEDDDEPRLMIDTSEDDEDVSPSQSSGPRKMPPLTFGTPERIKVFAEARPTLDKFMKDMKIPPELDKLFKDASVDLKKENLNCEEIPERFMNAMNTVMSSPQFAKAIYEMELSPNLVKALDEMEQLRESRSCGGTTSILQDSNVVIPGCEKMRKESNNVTNNPLTQLQDFVKKPLNFSGGRLPNLKISTTSANDSQGCEILPVRGVSSKPVSPVSDVSSSNFETGPLPTRPRFMDPLFRASNKNAREQFSRYRMSMAKAQVDLPASASENDVRMALNAVREEFGVPIRTSDNVAFVPRPLLPKHMKDISSKMNFVVNKLQNAAREEQQMQELQRLSGSSGIRHFRRFQAYIKQRYKDVSIVPPPSAYPSENFVPHVMDHPVPSLPALTVIPKYDSQINARKMSGRRSPPPMVPIKSFANLRKPLNDDQLMLRLKRLGTDIELEKTTVPTFTPQSVTDYRSSGMTDDDDDDEPMIPLSVDCILSTEPIVTIDETADALPLKYFDNDPPVLRKGVSRTYVPPPLPPPSLIPISSTSSTKITDPYQQFLYLHSTKSKTTIEAVPPSSKTVFEAVPSLVKRRPKRKQKTAFKSRMAKLAHALVQPAGATINNEIEIVNAFCRSPSFQDRAVPTEREVEIFKIEDTPSENVGNAEEDAFSTFIETKRLKENPIETKTVSESSSVESSGFKKADVEIALLEAPSEIPKDTHRSRAVTDGSELPENGKSALNKDRDENEASEMPDESVNTEDEETVLQPVEKTHLEEKSIVTDNSSLSPQQFSFHSDSAVTTNTLATGRKLYICKICSGVYCKMYSVKKHYFRNHINPRMVAERDALKFGLELNTSKGLVTEGFYRCSECSEIFVKMLDLKKHLLVHPVAANESSERNRKHSVSYRCDNCNAEFSKKKLYFKHLSDCARVVKPSVQEPTNPSEEHDNLEDYDEEKKDALGISRMCLFCDLTFTSTTARKTHVLQKHHPKRKHQSCSYCKNKKFSDLKDLLKHICEAHSKRYFGCAFCKIRFKTKGDLMAHNAESHASSQELSRESSKAIPVEETGKIASTTITKSGKVFKCTKCSKTFPTDKELKRHRKKGHNVAKQTSTVKTNGTIATLDPSEPKFRSTSAITLDHDTEYYRNLTSNIRFNMDFYLDGKISDSTAPNDLKTVTRSGLSQHLKTRSSVSQHLRREHNNENELTFEDMYGTQNLNGSFIANVSRLHLATQLAVLRKSNLLEKDPKIESGSTIYQASTTMAKELALTENSGNPECVEEIEDDDDSPFSGEWVRPKRYVCSTCFTRFGHYWDMDNHRWSQHPNVWVSCYEFPLDQAPGPDWAMKRCLSCNGALTVATESKTTSANPASKCSKCQKVVTPTSEFHKHILECGGDTTWTSTMFASSSLKKPKRWKPYSSRRRRNVGRVRGLKRNIPTTPVKIIGMTKNRQKAGDTETIQKMIANLPPKRITRRIIQFDDVESKNQNRNNNESNILTRKRREKLDSKTSAQIAKTSVTDSNIPVRTPDARKKKQKEEAAKISTTTLKKKSVKVPKLPLPVADAIKSTKNEDQTSDMTSKASKLDVEEEVAACSVNVIPEVPEAESVSPCASRGHECDVPSKKEGDDEHELDLENIEPADSDSLLPDSSVILAAMRETMRQTDSVVPSITFTSTTKKRKRDDTKCKPETKVGESCVELENKRTRDKQSGKLKQKKSLVENTAESCDHKNLKIVNKSSTDTENEDVTPEVSISNEILDTRSRRSVAEAKKADSICTITKTSKSDKVTKNTRTLRSNEANKNARNSETDESDQNQVSECVKVSTTTIDVMKTDENCENGNILETKTDSKIHRNNRNLKNPKINETSKPEKSAEMSKKSKDTHRLDASKSAKDLNSSAEVKKDNEEPIIISCQVCHSLSIRPICDNCSSIARRNKICVFCKQKLTARTNTLPVCEACKVGHFGKTETSAEGGMLPKRELVEWTQCKVCLRTNHRVVCSSCVAMSQKHKICARCNVRWEDPQKTGTPVCPPCEKEWYPQIIKDDEDVDKCTECSTLQTTEVTLRKLCNKCNSTSAPKKPCEPMGRSFSNEVSIQMNGMENSSTNVPVTALVTSVVPVTASNTVTASVDAPPAVQVLGSNIPTMPVVSSTSVLLGAPSNATTPLSSLAVNTSALPAMAGSAIPSISTSTTSKTIVEEAQINSSPSKKNVLLICKGCFGLYDKVSAYKQHCETCQARVSCMDEKKPLLGFVKRKTSVASNDANSGGASFEILENVQIKSYSLNEGEGKIESDSTNDVLLPVPGSVYDSDSSTSSKRLDLCKSSKRKRPLTSDESINETIESVIKAVCYDAPFLEESLPSNSVPKLCSRRSSDAAVEVSTPDLKNFEKVKNQLESSLVTSKMDDEANTEIIFSNEEQTPPIETSNVSKKKRKISTKKEISNSGRTTRSSLTRQDVEVPEITSESAKNPSESAKNPTKTAKKRKIKRDTSLLIDEEATEGNSDINTIATRLRRKPAVQTIKRTLRSRSKLEARESVDESENLEEDKVEEIHKVKKLKEVKKKTDDINFSVDGDQEEPASEEEDQSGKTRPKRQKSDSNDLGFAVIKANKPTRKSVKRDSFELSESDSKNELGESDLDKKSPACGSDVKCSTTPEYDNSAIPETSNNLPVVLPMSSQKLSDFLEAAPPTTSVAAHDEPAILDRFSYDESLNMDGYEASGPPYFDEGQPDGAQSTSWYSAINFLDQSSLGSILDSVNELLSRPEVASSCVADTIGSQSVLDTQNGELISSSLDDGLKISDESSSHQEDESPTLMDLDHQTAHHSETEAKEDEEKSMSLDQDQSIECSVTSSPSSVEEVCEVCNQPYPDLKSLKIHMSAVHQSNQPTTRSVASGKLRSSTRNNQNGVKSKQKCSHCQKVLVGKAEMAAHLKEHLQTFASNKNNADFLKKCIAEKLEDIFLNKALDNYMKSPQESSSVRNNPPLKILSQLNAAKKTQFSSWKSAIAHMLNVDPSLATVTSDKANKSSLGSSSIPKSIKQSKKTSTSASVLKVDATVPDSAEKEGYPCPMCPKTFQLTNLRNQHLIMVHAPRQSTHKHLRDNTAKKKDNSVNTNVKGEKNDQSESSTQPDGKVIHSYLLNESVNSCLEAKKEAVNKAIAESTKTAHELRKQVTTTQSCNSSSTEGPPPLEPAPSGEQILNNTDRSPPKLEAPAGLSVPSILRQNLTPSSIGGTSLPPKKGKPCRKKMSKKEIDLPPAVVKFKAEQALLELSINKFRKIRN